MDKNEFLKKLEKALADVPEIDLKEICYDYEEHFRNASAAGKTEVEIINSLGDPELIAKQYIVGYSRKTTETDRTILNIFRSALAKVHLDFVNFRRRKPGKSLTFGLLTALLLGVLALEIVVIISQNQVLDSHSNNQHQSSGNQANNELITVIKGYRYQAKFNQGGFVSLLNIAEKAQYNKDTIKTAGYILANVQFNTVTVLKIASLAGSADHEVEHLNDLLKVTITYGSESLKMIELARKAVNNEIGEGELEAVIQYYHDHSQAKTIEEAEKNMEETLDSL